MHTNLNLVILLLCFFTTVCVCTQINHPVIIIPGDGGSQLEAKLNKTSAPHQFCALKSKGYFGLWLNLEELVVPALYCFIDNMRLHYNNKTRTTHNTQGVDIRVTGFGETNAIEWLDPSEIGPNEMATYYKLLRTLVMETYALNFNRRVVILGHSMGNLHALYFLNHESQAWKDKYIEALVSVSAPWAGAVKTLRALTSGDTLSIYKMPASTLRAQQRSMTSTAWLMPARRFWSAREPLVVTAKRNYSTADYGDMFRDLSYPIGYQMYLDTADLIADLKPPGVRVYCLHGYGIQTPAQLIFKKTTWPDHQPEVLMGDGDGTVNIRSLETCKLWSGKQKQGVEYHRFLGGGHVGILNELDVIQYIRRILFKNRSEP